MTRIKSAPAEGSNPFASRMLKSTLLFLVCCLVWTASFVLVDKAHLQGRLATGSTATLLAVAGCTLLGVVMILAFIRHLAAMDELQQKVQLVAMGFAMGVTLVGAFSYSLLVTTGFVQEPEVKDLILLLTASYIVAVIVGQVRYR